MKEIKFNYVLSNGIEDCVNYNRVYTNELWIIALMDIQDIAAEYEAEILSVELVKE